MSKETSKWFSEQITKYTGDLDYELEGLCLAVTEEVCRIENDTDKLESILDFTTRNVIGILQNPQNLTLDYMNYIANKLGCRVKIRFENIKEK